MKTIRLLLLFVAVSALTIYSCSDSNPIQHESTTKSIALRTALNEIKKANSLTGRSAASNPFCFDFVYPLTLSLSNGITVTATSFVGLVELLANESAALYIDGVVFPFQVTTQGAVHTIHNEEEFTALLVNCSFPTWNNNLGTTFCFDIIFPVSIITPAGETSQIDSQEEFLAHLNSPANGTETQIVFPISVHYNGQVVIIHSVYEFYDMVNNCNTCVCSQEYAPVCVQTATGIVHYGNMCYATCAGYTQNDIVNCNPTACDISNLNVTVGACNSDGTYALTLNFTYANPGGTQMEIHHGNGILVGAYPLSSLPLTINHFPNNGTSADYLTVEIGPNCTATQQWAVPDCSSTCASNCPVTSNPVCVQTATGLVQFNNPCLAECAGFSQADFVDCGVVAVNFGSQLGSCFHIVYPVQVESGGQLVTINSDGDALQYWFPATAPIPAFVYPVTITIGNSVISVTNQAQFVQLINNECN